MPEVEGGPETSPEVRPEAGIPREERVLTRKEKILGGLKETFAHLREKGVSLPSFRKKLEAQARGEEIKEPEVKDVVTEIQEFIKAQLKERKELTISDVPKLASEMIEVISYDATSEQKQRLEQMKSRLADFEAKLATEKISPDPERATEQLGRILAGSEGEKLVVAISKLVAEGETPYPKPAPPKLGGGEKGFRGKERWLSTRVALGFIMVPAVVAATCILGGVYTRKMGEAVSPEGYEEAIKPRREAIQTKGAEALIIGRYLYRDLEGVEKQGERGKYLARLQLDKARDLIVEGAKIDGVRRKYELYQVKDPQVIARLIHDYPKDFPKDSSLSQIKDSGKRRQVEEFLDEFEEKETEETGYKPSLRETAKARAKQRSVSAQARASKRVSSRREQGLT